MNRTTEKSRKSHREKMKSLFQARVSDVWSHDQGKVTSCLGLCVSSGESHVTGKKKRRLLWGGAWWAGKVTWSGTRSLAFTEKIQFFSLFAVSCVQSIMMSLYKHLHTDVGVKRHFNLKYKLQYCSLCNRGPERANMNEPLPDTWETIFHWFMRLHFAHHS